MHFTLRQVGCQFLYALKGSADLNSFERSRFSGYYMYRQFNIRKFRVLST